MLEGALTVTVREARKARSKEGLLGTGGVTAIGGALEDLNLPEPLVR